MKLTRTTVDHIDASLDYCKQCEHLNVHGVLAGTPRALSNPAKECTMFMCTLQETFAGTPKRADACKRVFV